MRQTGAWKARQQVRSRVEISMARMRKWLLTFTQLLCSSAQVAGGCGEECAARGGAAGVGGGAGRVKISIKR